MLGDAIFDIWVSHKSSCVDIPRFISLNSLLDRQLCDGIGDLLTLFWWTGFWIHMFKVMILELDLI